MTLKWKALKAVPGVSVAIMATVTFFYTFIPPELLIPISKRLWIAGICLLGIAEILAIYRANAEQIQESQDRFDQMMDRFEQVQSASDAHQQAMLRLFQVINDPAESLKKRALVLSEQMWTFISERLQSTPTVRPAPQWGNTLIVNTAEYFRWSREQTEHSQSLVSLSRHQVETIQAFQQRFLERARGIGRELRDLELADQRLDEALDRPVSMDDIKTIGECIGDLASRIGEDKASASDPHDSKSLKNK